MCHIDYLVLLFEQFEEFSFESGYCEIFCLLFGDKFGMLFLQIKPLLLHKLNYVGVNIFQLSPLNFFNLFSLHLFKLVLHDFSRYVRLLGVTETEVPEQRADASHTGDKGNDGSNHHTCYNPTDLCLITIVIVAIVLYVF